MFSVHFTKLRKNDLKGTISFKTPLTQSSLKESVKFNTQYITAIKCVTTQNIREIGGSFGTKLHFFPL